MDIRKVKKLIELLEESGIAEIEISEGEESVRISRYPHRPGARSGDALRGAAGRAGRTLPRRSRLPRPPRLAAAAPPRKPITR